SGSAQANAASAQANARDLRQLADDRQKMADDLANLEQNMRNAARELSSGQRAAAEKLRGALDGIDQSDLETRLQRTADWLRSGVDPNSNGTESQVASDLQRLSDQLHQAQQSLVAGGQQQTGDNTEAALNTIERLRRQIEALGASRDPHGQNADGRNQGQGPAGQNYQTGALTRDGQQGQNGQGGQQGQGGTQGQTGQSGQNAQGSRAGQGSPQGGGPTNSGPGYRGDGMPSERFGGGGYGGGGVTDNVGLGKKPRHSGRTAPATSTTTIDRQQVIQQGVTELNRLRQQSATDPETQKQIQELISAMEHLDLKRFPGNPQMVEELHQRLLSGVDTLELRLRR